jgi:hypothetical protein
VNGRVALELEPLLGFRSGDRISLSTIHLRPTGTTFGTPLWHVARKQCGAASNAVRTASGNSIP